MPRSRVVMKLVVALAFLLIIVLATFLVLKSLSDNPTQRVTAIETLCGATIEVETWSPPLYPDSVTVSEYPNSPPGSRFYVLETTDTFTAVNSYYKTIIQQQGWSILSETSVEMEDVTYKLAWQNPAGTAPARRYLGLSIYHPHRGNVASVDIYIQSENWPDANKVPVYPDAQSTSTNWDKDPVYGWPRRITTFTTGDSPACVSEFYDVALSQHGWLKIATEGHIYPGTVYDYSRGSSRPGEGVGSQVIVDIQTSQDNLTSVRIIAIGAGIEIPEPVARWSSGERRHTVNVERRGSTPLRVAILATLG
jgi:hypothetical protein